MTSESQVLPFTCSELSRRTGAELVSESVSSSQARLTFRVPRGQGTVRWHSLMKQILRLSRQAPWGLDVSKHYFLLNGSDDYRYSWRIIFQGENLSSYDKAIGTSFTEVRVRASQLMEVPLHGSPNRSPTAGLAGTVPTGPLAVRRS